MHLVLVGKQGAQFENFSHPVLQLHIVIEVAVVDKDFFPGPEVSVEDYAAQAAESRMVDHAEPGVGVRAVVRQVGQGGAVGVGAPEISRAGVKA